MKSFLFPILLIGAAVLSHPAQARDSQHLACSGFVTLTDGDSTEKLGVSVDYMDTRAADGVSRKDTFSTVYQGDLYQGVLTNGMVVLSDQAHPERTFFSGSATLTLVGQGSYQMQITGSMTDDPSNASAAGFSATASFPCVDLSN